jgi:hypothetical protein
MAPTKSSRPRQIEKESGARVPNLPTGPDHEDDTTNQGSGDVRAPNLPNLPIGPDHEDDTTNQESGDVGAPNLPNLPTGPDHEDDTTNQGSGDAGAPNLPNLPTGPNLEDEDGDHEHPSPSSYLNLDQHESEEDATNAEHEGDVNEE